MSAVAGTSISSAVTLDEKIKRIVIAAGEPCTLGACIALRPLPVWGLDESSKEEEHKCTVCRKLCTPRLPGEVSAFVPLEVHHAAAGWKGGTMPNSVDLVTRNPP